MEEYDCIIIGGGVTGLCCAYELCKKGKNVLIMESAKELGGMLASIKKDNYNIEMFYHHIFPEDEKTLSIIKDIGMSDKLYWSEPQTSFWHNNKFFRLSGPVDLLSFSPLSSIDKIRFALFMAGVKLTKDFKKLDNIKAEDYIIKGAGQNVYHTLFEPLLKSKFGNDKDKASASWFVSRMNLRSNTKGKGERLGYLKGGFENFIKGMVSYLESKGTKILRGTPVTKIIMKEGKNEVFSGAKKFVAKTVAFTANLDILPSILQLPEEYKARISKLEYQGAVCVLVSLKKKIGSHYWINLLTENNNIGALIHHTNFISSAEYNNEELVYLASYPSFSEKVWNMSDKEIFDAYFNDLKKVYPELVDSDVNWYSVGKSRKAGLIYSCGLIDRMPDITGPYPCLFLGGMFNTYPDRTIEKSLKVGVRMAEKIIEDISSHSTLPIR